MTAAQRNVDVLVVGAGPVGLALAAELRRLGVSVLLVDKQPSGSNTSRACVIHSRTLETLEPLGVTESLLDQGLRVPIFRIRDRDRALATIDFSELETVYPFTVMFPQDRTEQLLLKTLEGFGGEVVRPAEFLRFESEAQGMVAQLAVGGEVARVGCQWLVGCDGMHSRVRDCAGIAFEGAAYPEGFVLADVRMAWPLGRDEVTLFYSPEGLMVVAPLPMDHFRIVATDVAAPESPSMAYVQSLIDTRGPADSRGIVNELAWSSRFRVHHRVASSARMGRVLLCGDAAHVHSPAGGQGMNTGIQDAMSLAPILAEAVGEDLERRIDAWVQRRHQIAQDVVSMTDRMTRVATLKSPLAQSMRNSAVSLLGRIPAVRDSIARTLAELDNR